MSALIPTDNYGFCFENFQRNENLLNLNYKMPNSTKTGTTICGIICKDAVILGADTRCTNGDIIADKNCDKLDWLSDNMYCAGAGTAADLFKVTRMISSQIQLHGLFTGKTVPVVAAIRMLKQHLFQYQGHIGCAVIIGGYDDQGFHLYSVSPHGSARKLQYASMGSGCLAAMAILEKNWKPDLTIEEGTLLVRNAIAAGILNDLGSGSNIDICIIKKDGCQYIKTYEVVSEKKPKEKTYKFKHGSTAIINRKIIPLKTEATIVRQLEAEPMDTL